MQSRTKDLVLGALVGLFLSIPILYKNGYFLPIPYSYVELVEEKRLENELLLSFNFEKNACVFEDVRVFGQYLGRWTLLDHRWFEEEDGTYRFFAEGQGDRLKGSQTVNLAVLVKKTSYTKIEIRTRHICDGKVVDRVFATITPKE